MGKISMVALYYCINDGYENIRRNIIKSKKMDRKIKKMNEIPVKIHKGKAYVSMKKYMPIVLSADDKFRKGIEIDYCSICNSFQVIGMYCGKKKYCDKCTDKHFKIMNRKMKKYPNKLLPIRIDSFNKRDLSGKDEGYFAEYDGFHFEGKSIKAVVNQILKYIFNGGED